MKTGIKVGDIMTRNFVSVGPKTSIHECVKIMVKNKVGSAVVMSDKKLKGIITEGDIMRAIAKKISLKEPVSKIMTKKVYSIRASKDIYDAIVLMKKKKVRWLPVVIKKHVIGFLTEKDILKIQPELFEIVVENLHIAEEKEKWKRIKAVDEYGWVKEGPCDECGAFDLLYKVGNRYLCANCRKNESGMWEE